MSNETITAVLIASGSVITLLLLFLRLQYSKLLVNGSLNLTTSFAAYTISQTGHGLRSFGVGKQLFGQITLPFYMPELYIDGYKKERPLFDSPLYYNHNQKISLEGDFSDYFDVYVPQNSQVEALQLLSPDVMILIRDSLKQFDIHCAGNSLAIRCSQAYCTQESMQQSLTYISQKAYTVFHKRSSFKPGASTQPTLVKDTSTESLRIFNRRYKARFMGILVFAIPIMALNLLGLLLPGVSVITVIIMSIISLFVLAYIYIKYMR